MGKFDFSPSPNKKGYFGLNLPQGIIKVKRSTSPRISILEPQQKTLPLNLRYTNEPVNSPLFQKLIRVINLTETLLLQFYRDLHLIKEF